MRLPPLPPSLPLFLLLLHTLLPPPTLSHPLGAPSSISNTPGVGPNLTNPAVPVSEDPSARSYLLNITPVPGWGNIGRSIFTQFVSSLLPEVEGVIAQPGGQGALTPLGKDPWEVKRQRVRLWLQSVSYSSSSSLSTISEGEGGPTTGSGGSSSVSTAKLRRRHASPFAPPSTTTSLLSSGRSFPTQTQPQRRGGGGGAVAAANTVDYLDYGLLHFLITELGDMGRSGEWKYGACKIEVSVLEDDGAIDVVAKGTIEEVWRSGVGVISREVGKM